MFLASKLDPTVIFVSVLAILIIILGLILKRYQQPYIIGYILVGALLGEQGIDLIHDQQSIHNLGEIGIILLLFFIGMEISLPELIKQWKLAVIGTLLQVGISVLIVISIGHFLNWNMNRSIILGFVIALSSSAVIIKIIVAAIKAAMQSRMVVRVFISIWFIKSDSGTTTTINQLIPRLSFNGLTWINCRFPSIVVMNC